MLNKPIVVRMKSFLDVALADVVHDTKQVDDYIYPLQAVHFRIVVTKLP